MGLEHALIQGIAGRSALNPEAPPPMNLEDAVREQLVLLLNTKRGSLAHLPRFGIPDLSEFYTGFPGSLGALRDAIQESIELYEPRLAGPRVVLTDKSVHEFAATFLIEGTISAPGTPPKPVSFRTQVTSLGFGKVEP